ncbi:MAG: response regulator transcription factor [Dehalococcoidales bacterium]|nr:response regulator transcription factor [Dehalococcoidales bacterium]
MKKILVVDDEKKIVEIVKAYLEKEGYKVMAAYDGKSALESARRDLPDLIILDLMLPEVSGWDVCRELRRESDVPVIMLTARDDITDKVIGLELGADDYITKPFDPKEVISRVRAVLRRSEGKVVSGTALQVGDITVDVDRRLVRRADQPVELTPIEFDLLKMMAGSPGRVYSRMQLLDGVKGDAYEGYERTVDSHIKNLRKKLEPDPEHPRYIKTVYGVGYKLEEGRSA